MESKGIMVFGSKKDSATLLRNGNEIEDIGQRIMRDMEGALGQKNLFDLIIIMKFSLLV